LTTGDDMKRRLLFGLLAACLMLMLAGPVYAAPAPTDGKSQGSAGPQQVFQTALFGLGEVDLSTLGVNPIELLTVGPLLTPTSTNDGILIVDDNMLDCPNAQFTSIQAAVTAANPGDKIKVCPGLYMEQVTIPADKDGLTLFSEGAFQAVIKAPLVMLDPKAIVRVNGAENVTIRHFTITGPGAGDCDSIRYGVRVDNGGSALITDNHITEIHDTPFSGCQNGFGVDIGRVADSGVGTGTVVHNLIDRYQKGGVIVSNTGSSAEVAYNEVVGMGRTSVIAQNGIQVSADAYGDVHHNRVSQNYYLGEENEATGILLFLNPVARAHHNDVFLNESGVTTYFANQNSEMSYNNSRNNDYGIVAYNPTINALISYNKAYENTLVDCRDDNTPQSNRWVKDLGRTESQPGLCKQAGPQ
jgi:hypothetical protein